MKRAHLCVMGLLALVFMAANAKAGTTNFTLVQTAKPIMRAYPGVHADVLGIQTGMTAAQAEAIAEKNYPEQRPGVPTPLFMAYTGPGFTGDLLETKHLVPGVTFSKLAGDTNDILTLDFTTPALGSTVYAITRDIDFLPGTGKTRVYPPIDAIRASLIKKYGPPSYQTKYGPSREHGAVYGSNGGLMLAWVFSKDLRLDLPIRELRGADSAGSAIKPGDVQATGRPVSLADMRHFTWLSSRFQNRRQDRSNWARSTRRRCRQSLAVGRPGMRKRRGAGVEPVRRGHRQPHQAQAQAPGEPARCIGKRASG